ncbi:MULTISPECIES: hypothetical protein [unclassified Rhizobium]|uniref:hypothetical protein n=1 Tax=unclassified Rhizobium TaxID=2613769 RepID=UPI000EA8FA33|nr:MULTISPECIES: hypothetical protein [unclassified Rhizobium]AYG65899.1 hypothetical protein CCGE531_07740 [Rhizobium sp. CCGE531]AYG72380.1 hypothetical protein CCGE532_07740 [Rhizobium sp. CCGE532]
MREISRHVVLGLPLVVITAVTGVPALAGENCYCKNTDGKQHAVGEVACMTIGDRSYLAQCEMNLNVTSWAKLQDGCPVTERVLWRQSAWHPAPMTVR